MILARRLENPRFTKIETLPRAITSITSAQPPEDMDGEMLARLREAHRVGRQERPRFFLHG